MLLSRKVIPFFIYPVLGLCVGWGWEVSTLQSRGNKSEPPANSGRARSVSDAAQPMTVTALQEQASRLVNSQDLSKGPLAIHISGWSDERLLLALDEAVNEQEAFLSEESIATALLAEFAKRDPQRAMEWVLGQQAVLHEKFAWVVVNSYLPDRVDEAVVLLGKHRQLLGYGPHGEILEAQLTNAAQLGANALVAELINMRQYWKGCWHLQYTAELPAGFDFTAMLESPDFKKLTSYLNQGTIISSHSEPGDFWWKYSGDVLEHSMVRRWVEMDSDSAIRWLLENRSPDRLLIFISEYTQSGYLEQVSFVRTLDRELYRLTAEQKTNLADSIRTNGMNPNDSKLWIQLTDHAEIKDAILDFSANHFFAHVNAYGERELNVLESLPDVEERLRLLDEVDLSMADERRQMDSDVAQKIRARLLSWGAEESRVESIMKRAGGVR